ncbi:N-acetylglutamate synthase-like GNAT family acetyltransferase [Neorhizobium galegae]|uniref:GNAT family N-acetyltransferase n=1 Tax=Neorhizobium galegae TaxID=399 RepID=UPI001AE71E14|nr:GNAT family N-acetyltransferase [Neorhizobium galegae]MBP2548466.1 N-acetylglutamate synthase-like GNAT family acetyltransferase [Neorhizobium galegae]
MITIAPIPSDFADWQGLLSLILQAFSYMDAVIDPPSSAHRLTPATLAEKARDETGFLAHDGDTLVGCMFLKPETASLYVGKLAISPACQGRGIGRLLLQAAEAEAKRLNLPALRLDTRIELVANHATFAAWGFAKTAEKSHPGYDRPTFIEMRKTL